MFELHRDKLNLNENAHTHNHGTDSYRMYKTGVIYSLIIQFTLNFYRDSTSQQTKPIKNGIQSIVRSRSSGRSSSRFTRRFRWLRQRWSPNWPNHPGKTLDFTQKKSCRSIIYFLSSGSFEHSVLLLQGCQHRSLTILRVRSDYTSNPGAIVAAPIAAYHAPIAAAYHAPIAAYSAPIAAAYHAPIGAAYHAPIGAYNAPIAAYHGPVGAAYYH